MTNKYVTPTTCPKCGGELSDHWDGELVSAFVGEWSDDRFHCEGEILSVLRPKYAPSCGYFGLKDFGIDYEE